MLFLAPVAPVVVYVENMIRDYFGDQTTGTYPKFRGGDSNCG